MNVIGQYALIFYKRNIWTLAIILKGPESFHFSFDFVVLHIRKKRLNSPTWEFSEEKFELYLEENTFFFPCGKKIRIMFEEEVKICRNKIWYCICSLELHNKVPQIRWLRRTGIYHLTILQAKYEIKVMAGLIPLGAAGRICSMLLPLLLVVGWQSVGFPGL